MSSQASEDCEKILVRYLSAVDRGDATSAIDCFTDEASVSARGRPLQGRVEIAEFLADRDRAHADGRRTAHLVTNVAVEQTDGGRLQLPARLVFLMPDEHGRWQIENILDTTQLFVRTPAGWQIHTRTEHPLTAL